MTKTVLALLLLLSSATSVAQSNPFVEPPADSALPGLEAFVDGVVETAFVEHGALPGVTVSVVKDGEIILLKGYGLADVESETPVDPARTLFRIGSISKTFTGLAVMQMVDQGRLDLDADVNTYLEDFQIPEAFDAPITLRHLLNHRAGFEDATAGQLFVREEADAISMGEYLAEYMPARVRPPGESSSYTNYGITLAGYIVQVVSGQDFAAYLDENIFLPLEMHHSTIREPLAAGGAPTMRPELVTLLATGYNIGAGGKPEAKPHDLIGRVGPAGAISSTAEDMAKYMIARLDEERPEDALFVSPEMAVYMQTRTYEDRPLIPDMVYAMIEGSRDGYRFRWHNGGSSAFFSDMMLYPELQLGIFVSTNSNDGGPLLSATLPKLIFERYYPSKLGFQALKPPADFAERGQKYAGQYLPTRRSYTKLEKLIALSQVFAVSVDAEGYLLVQAGPETRKYVEVGEGVFRSAEAEEGGRNQVSHLYFYEDEDGVPERISVSTNDPMRIGVTEGPSFFFTSLGLALLLATTSLLGAWRRARRGLDQTAPGRWATILWTTGAIAVVFIVAGLGLTVASLSGGSLDPIIFDWPPAPLATAVLASNAAVLLTIMLLVLLLPAWREPGWSLWRKLQYTAFTLSLLMLGIGLNEWNMIGFKY